MDLFREYRRRYPVRPALIGRPPAARLFNVVVIPCYDEQDEEVAATLDSLAACTLPHRDVEVILLINAPAGADPAVIARNRGLFRFLTDNTARWENERLSLSPLLIEDLSPAEAGVGVARKTGMDEALYRLEAAGAGDGILTSLDADTRVDRNYLSALEEMFLSRPAVEGVSIYFEHSLEGPFPAAVYDGIVQYELHLRYFVQALRYIHYPFAWHTVGSAFAVRAGAYMRQGGMNKKQGGEDFYFLQKIIMEGHFAALTTTKVFPSPRPARKVPFGTGPEIHRFLTGEKDTYLTYNLQAFRDLDIFFRQVPQLFGGEIPPEDFYATLPASLKLFLAPEAFSARIREILGNVATERNFMKRFYRWFNTFRVIKYLNMIHREYYDRRPVFAEAAGLLRLKGIKKIPGGGVDLLEYYRNLDRKTEA